MVKKELNLEIITGTLLALIIVLALSTGTALAAPADPGHEAIEISAGIFESGNYTFPDTLHIQNYLNVSGLLWVDPVTSMVGIGTVSPNEELDIASATPEMRFNDTDTESYFDVGASGTDFKIYVNDTSPNGITISSAGKVGIGTTTPANVLDVRGEGNFSGTIYINNATDISTFATGTDQWWGWTNTTGIVYTTQSSDLVHIGGNVSMADNLTVGGNALYVDSSSGRVGIGTTTPAAMLHVFDSVNNIGRVLINGASQGTLILGDSDETTDEKYFQVKSTGAQLILGYVSDNFGTAGNQIVLNRSGEVGIGTDLPGYAKLNVTGTIDAWQVTINGTVVGTGSGSMDYTNIAMLNETVLNDTYARLNDANTFTTNATFSDSVNITEDLEAGGALFVDGKYGNVGIGTTTPANTLDVRGEGNFSGTIYINNATDITTLTGAGNLSNYAVTNTTDQAFEGLVHFSANVSMADNLTVGGDKLYVGSSSGRVGIGTTTPSATLEVAGSLNVTGGNTTLYGGLEVVNSSNTANKYLFVDNETGKVGIGTPTPGFTLDLSGNLKLAIPSASTFTNYLCSSATTQEVQRTPAACGTSDVRYKKNIRTIDNALEKVGKIRGVYFNWKDEYPELGPSNESQIGSIAQEVEPIVPELVFTNPDGSKVIDYPKMTSLLVEAVKQLKTENELLKSELCKKDSTHSWCGKSVMSVQPANETPPLETPIANNVPVIESFSPENDVVLSVGEAQEFTIVATDADSDDVLSLQWFVDDLAVANQTSGSFEYWPSEAGVFEVKVLITDGKDYAVHKWPVTVNAEGQSFSITGAAVGVVRQGSSSLLSWLKSLF